MPTPVSTAKQCLTQQAAHALDEAVSVARGLNHAQTTSLHAVSAFLSLPSSPLRDACLRARNPAFYCSSSRAQIRALELALSLSLDRSPVSQQRVAEPPVSNSLMAAIKRSQANQRRQSDGLIYKQETREAVGSAGIKVEIHHLTVAILDDPIISRVFSEAGFSSLDVKFSMLMPLQGFWRSTHSQNHMKMISSIDIDIAIGDEEFRRIWEVVGRNKGRNPLLFGVCARDAVSGFVERCRKGRCEELLPEGVRGVRVVSLESEIAGFGRSEEVMRRRFAELGRMVEDACGPGLVVCYGDLKEFVKEEEEEEGLGRGLVAEFTKLISCYRGRVWLIGCATYEVYLRFLSKFPCVDKDWDLHPLAITSSKTAYNKPDVCFKSRQALDHA